tara:strand:+ start:1039 stop:1254 length:216 start_codon:yes stop_codon:yes gene_type:complete
MARQKYIEGVGQVDYTPEEEAEANTLEKQHTQSVQNFKDKIELDETKKASGKQKLKDLGLDDDEIKALIGV